jgi:phosphatidate cytidylyltransferase
MKNFIKRLLTGIIYAGIIIFCVIQSPYTFLALFMLMIILCLREFYRFVSIYKGIKINLYLHGAGGALLFLTFFLYTSGIAGRSVFSLYTLYVAGVLIYELYAKQKEPITRLACIFFGQCYIALPFSLLNVLAFPGNAINTLDYQWIWIISLLAFIWVNDTGAYTIGVRFGKHRLWERISPKKSWEGFFGGLALAVISAFVFAHFHPQVEWYHWVALSAIIVVFGTYGDLVESLIKRELAVKDSGTALPGHGGFLDRFDSLLLAVYGMLLYTWVFIQS